MEPTSTPRVERTDGPLPQWTLSAGHTSARVAPSRGGLVTSFRVGDDELLSLDEATLLDPSKNVRGGVPLLFPFAGKPPPGSTLPQHGFARRRAWEVLATDTTAHTARLECALQDDAETRAAWPFAFELRFAVTVREGQLGLEWRLHNRGDAPLPLHFGIHPYFRVGEKARVRVAGAHGPAFDNRAQVERQVDAVDFTAGEVDLHFPSSPDRVTTLERGLGLSVELSWTGQFDTLVLWTLPEQPFVCVEPWAGRGGQPATRFVPPGETERLAVTLRTR